MNRLLVVYLTVALSALTAAEAWSAALLEWKAEIESTGHSVVPVTVVTDPASQTMRFEGEVLHRAVIARYMQDDHFRAQLVTAHALTLNYNGPEGRLHFIVINGARSAEWSGHAEGMLAHEVGHAWLDAKGFEGLRYDSGPAACIAIHSSDVVQHVLIRAQMKRRGINGADYWLSKLTPLMEGLETDQPPKVEGPCNQAMLLSQWLDARLGTSPEDWTRLQPLEQKFAAAYPRISELAREIEATVRAADLENQASYRAALRTVASRMSVLAE